MRKKLFVLLMVTALLVSISATAYAITDFRTTFDNTYGVNFSYANGCGLCHLNGIPGATRIFYGVSFEAQAGHSNVPGGTVAAFTAIEGVDSDGDGFTNIQEINALTNPSDPNSFPAAATMPVPSAGLQIFDYLAVKDPVADVDPAKTKPVGIGTFAEGVSPLTISLNLPQFSGPVDIYGAALSSVDQYIVSLVEPSLAAFQTLTLLQVDQIFSTGILPPGVVPTIANTAGPENMPDIISQAVAVPPFNDGLYTVYVVVTPQGDFSNAYVWRTNFNVGVPAGFTTMEVATSLSGSEMVPPVDTSATGNATLAVDLTTGAIISSAISFDGLTSNVTAAHIHVGSEGTPLGPIIVPFTCTGTTTGTCTPQSASPLLSAAQIAALMNDNLYFVVHSANNPTGEIRGQVVFPIFSISAELSGVQEVPGNTTAGSGLAQFTVDTSTGELKGSVSFSGLTGPAQASHIHLADFGHNGDVVIPLEGGNGATSGVYQVPANTILSPTLMAALRANGLYVNIHTAANSGGEIRGQLINVSGF